MKYVSMISKAYIDTLRCAICSNSMEVNSKCSHVLRYDEVNRLTVPIEIVATVCPHCYPAVYDGTLDHIITIYGSTFSGAVNLQDFLKMVKAGSLEI